jgi:DNA-binding FadR family transcriptional regulator
MPVIEKTRKIRRITTHLDEAKTVAPVRQARKKAPKVKAAERVAIALRREIATGVLRPGDRLPAERLLQDKFEVSRPTVREAMRLLESESLIDVFRGQHGGGRVRVLDIKVAARQVGVYLQMLGTTLQDIWKARSVIEPAGAGLLATQPRGVALQKMEENIAAAYDALEDPVEYADLTTKFSEILTDYCGNQTLSTFAMLIHDVVGRHNTQVTVKTYAQRGVDRMRRLNIRAREKMLTLIRTGAAEEAENYWREHLAGSGAVVFSAYKAQVPIDVVQLPTDEDDAGRVGRERPDNIPRSREEKR